MIVRLHYLSAPCPNKIKMHAWIAVSSHSNLAVLVAAPLGIAVKFLHLEHLSYRWPMAAVLAA